MKHLEILVEWNWLWNFASLYKFRLSVLFQAIKFNMYLALEHNYYVKMTVKYLKLFMYQIFVH